MDNFIFQNPVKLIMGRGMISRLSEEIPADKRVMITFGGGSVKKNGVYDQVKEALKNHFTVEFWGIEPNPSIRRPCVRPSLSERRKRWTICLQ